MPAETPKSLRHRRLRKPFAADASSATPQPGRLLIAGRAPGIWILGGAAVLSRPRPSPPRASMAWKPSSQRRRHSFFEDATEDAAAPGHARCRQLSAESTKPLSRVGWTRSAMSIQLAEAEVFLASMGAMLQAEERLQGSDASPTPTRMANWHSKLLEIYAKRGDTDRLRGCREGPSSSMQRPNAEGDDSGRRQQEARLSARSGAIRSIRIRPVRTSLKTSAARLSSGKRIDGPACPCVHTGDRRQQRSRHFKPLGFDECTGRGASSSVISISGNWIDESGFEAGRSRRPIIDLHGSSPAAVLTRTTFSIRARRSWPRTADEIAADDADGGRSIRSGIARPARYSVTSRPCHGIHSGSSAGGGRWTSISVVDFDLGDATAKAAMTSAESPAVLEGDHRRHELRCLSTLQLDSPAAARTRPAPDSPCQLAAPDDGDPLRASVWSSADEFEASPVSAEWRGMKSGTTCRPSSIWQRPISESGGP